MNHSDTALPKRSFDLSHEVEHLGAEDAGLNILTGL